MGLENQVIDEKNELVRASEVAMKFAIDLHFRPTIGLRLPFGRHHKSLFRNYKPFHINYLQTLFWIANPLSEGSNPSAASLFYNDLRQIET